MRRAIFSRFSSLTPGLLLITRETVAIETPASLAMSVIVTLFDFDFSVRVLIESHPLGDTTASRRSMRAVGHFQNNKRKRLRLSVFFLVGSIPFVSARNFKSFGKPPPLIQWLVGAGGRLQGPHGSWDLHYRTGKLK